MDEGDLLRREAERARPGIGSRRRVTGWPIAAAIALVLAFLYSVRQILLPFVAAAAIAFVVTPAVDWLHRKIAWLPRVGAAVVVYLALLALFAGLGYWGGTLIVNDVVAIASTAPQIVQHTLTELLGPNTAVLGQRLDPEAIARDAITSAKTFLVDGGGGLLLASVGVTAAFTGILGLVLLIYFLISGKRIVDGTLWLIPPEHRPEVAAMAEKVAPLLRRYLIGLLVIVTYTAIVGWIGFGPVFNLPHAPLLGLIVGILELIPVAGPFTSAVLVGLTAIQQASPWAAFAIGGFAVVLRISIDQFVGPIVLGRATDVHPVVVMFAFLSGAVIFGIIGLILAVPVAATIRLVLTHYYAERIKE
jgi:predicted PurR-regulated permease PerM